MKRVFLMYAHLLLISKYTVMQIFFSWSWKYSWARTSFTQHGLQPNDDHILSCWSHWLQSCVGCVPSIAFTSYVCYQCCIWYHSSRRFVVNGWRIGSTYNSTLPRRICRSCLIYQHHWWFHYHQKNVGHVQKAK